MNPPVRLRADDGAVLPLELERWHNEPSPIEARFLAALEAPVLDVGCGPGRVVHHLALCGTVAMGIDPAPAAVRLARGRGCAVLQRSVFERVPLEGRWATVLLLDGNIGIGGDPIRLLARCRALLGGGGRVLAEVAEPGSTSRACLARLERHGEVTDWFPWAVLSADGALALGAYDVIELEANRWIACFR